MNLENDECGEPKEKSCLPRLFLVLVFLIIFISLARRLVGGALSAGVLFRERKETLLYFFSKKNAASSRDGTPAEPTDHVVGCVLLWLNRVVTFF